MQFPFAGAGAPTEPTMTPGAATAFEGDSSASTLREIWAAVYRSRYWIAGIFAVCIALGITLALLSTRLYQATASIEVRQEAEKVLGTEQDREDSSSRADAERFLQTQLDIIRSRGVAEAVAESEGLFRGEAFLNTMRVPDADVQVPLGMSPRDAQRARVIKALRDNMQVRYTGTTRIAAISFTSPDPRLSARIANSYATSYIRNNLARKAGSSVYALDFLRDQLREAQARLAKSEQEVVDYARRTRIVDAGNAAGNATTSDASARPVVDHRATRAAEPGLFHRGGRSYLCRAEMGQRITLAVAQRARRAVQQRDPIADRASRADSGAISAATFDTPGRLSCRS